MNYTKDSTISSIDDVEKLFRHIIFELKITTFHPDDDFSNYDNQYGEQFSEKEITMYNSLLDECFDVCEENGIDVYKLALDIYIEE